MFLVLVVFRVDVLQNLTAGINGFNGGQAVRQMFLQKRLEGRVALNVQDSHAEFPSKVETQIVVVEFN